MQKPVAGGSEPPQSPFPDFSAYQVTDPEVFGRNMLRLFEESGKVMGEMFQRSAGATGQGSTVNEMTEMSKLFSEVAQHWMADPAKLAETQGQLVQSFVELWQATTRKMAGDPVEPVITPEPGDNRFRDAEWSSNPYFDYWKQAYLLTTKWAEQMVKDTKGLDETTRQRVDFYLRQFTSAMSPSNFPATNPEVIRETYKSNAGNLVSGMENLAGDLAKSGSLLKISQTDTSAFEVGKNVATTPGKVVFQNDLLQLLQYTPATAQVHEVPFMIVPPWINKFYILDLTPQKSFIKYLVDQGFTVFVVSWVNPDERLAAKTFEDYMKEGLLGAATAVQRECGVKKINVLGYCVAGTLLGATLAYLAARGEEPFVSATFLTAQVDFTKAGDLKIFIDDAQLKSVEKLMAEKGYLEGSRMATVFNMLRPKDLIWPYVVNNYLMGKKPMAFDLLFWNQDSTRMPAANHNFYLREFYHENKLALGKMKLGGVHLDLGKVTLPIYDLAAREDHIAPVRSVFIGAKMLGAPVTFVMSGSGHIAGVVNPPAKPKYQYWTNSKPLSHPDTATFEQWVAGTTETPGSWWPHHAAWLAKHSGPMIDARKPGAKLGVIEDAPGSYVKAKG
jgi:polyhydroxyalkanoate synthase subunit PhaC